jgi:hypothetical protein
MTLEERLNDLMANLPYQSKTAGGLKGFRERLRLALLEVARDQRHACAEAVMATQHAGPGVGVTVWKDEAHAAAMNAGLPDGAPELANAASPSGEKR